MRVTSVPSLTKRKKADLLVLPCVMGKKTAELLTPKASKSLSEIYEEALATGDFQGKQAETLLLYSKKLPEKRLLLLGLGPEAALDLEQIRRAYSEVQRVARSLKLETVQVLVPSTEMDQHLLARGIVEGVDLANYSFDQLRLTTKEEAGQSLVKHLILVGPNAKAKKEATAAKHICDSVHFARDLIMGNADDVTPQFLAKEARRLAREFPKIKTSVFDKKRLQKEKMGLILAVNRGSTTPPVLITMQYRGAPKSKDNTVIVGKGITFDTGGLNLKPTGSMELMRKDMSGAACAFGLMYAVAKLGLKRNVTVVVPSTENGIDGNSYKPGDVYVGYGGKSVEIGNTDAEGRLVLADALAYTVKKLKPSRIVDVATLTGAMIMALGHHVTGLMTNNDELAERLFAAGEHTYDRVWRLPMYEEYREQLKSGVADLKSTGGRGAGSITAGWFLREFVGDVPWAHCDIAGTSWKEAEKHYQPRYAAGAGVRLLVEFIRDL